MTRTLGIWTSADGQLMLRIDWEQGATNLSVFAIAARSGHESPAFYLPLNGLPCPVHCQLKPDIELKGTLWFKALSGNLGKGCVWADIYSTNVPTRLHPRRFEGALLECFLGEVPEPVEPAEPPLPPYLPDESHQGPEEASAEVLPPGQNLFPYVYLRHWPALDSVALATDFIAMPSALISQSLFIGELARCKSQGQRAAMARLAERYLQTDQSASPPTAPLQLAWERYLALLLVPGFAAQTLAPLTLELTEGRPQAPILLPAALFPLPQQTASPPAPPGQLAPYAIGELQMLRQRLIGYELGDIARVQSLMPGERQHLAQSQGDSQLRFAHSQQQSHSETQNSADEDWLNSQLHQQRTVMEKLCTDDYQNLNTHYGPPTEATLSGTVSHKTQAGDNPASKDRTQLARHLLDKSLSLLANSQQQQSGQQQLSQRQRLAKSRFDNSTSNEPRIGVYRWLNRRFEAFVVHYGNRLMFECLLPKPAAAYIRQQRRLCGQELAEPKPLASFGISDWSGLDSQLARTLAVRYQALDIAPCPASRVQSLSLRAGEQRTLAIPPGYQVSAVALNTLGGEGRLLAADQQLSGQQQLRGTALFGEEQSLALCAEATGTDFLAAVKVSCEPSATLLEQWQQDCYQRLQAAYQRQAERYYRQQAPALDAQPRESLRQVERHYLKAGAKQLLLARQQQDAPAWLSRPRLEQFFDDAIEWQEMSYRFFSEDDTELPCLDSQADPLFSAFLQAASARLLLPVRPDREKALLYYLQSGAPWPLDNSLCPVHIADAPLVHQLQALPANAAQRLVGEPWTEQVPTHQQVLDSSTALPWQVRHD